MSWASNIPELASGELGKIFSRPKYKIYTLILVLYVIGGSLLSLIPGNVLHFTMRNYPNTVLSSLSHIFIPIVIFMLASDLITGEIGSNQIRVIITRPVSRYKILFGKALAIIGYVTVTLAVVFIISAFLCVLMSGFDPFSLLRSVVAYIISFVPYTALTSLAILAAVNTKSSTSCFVICLLLYAGFLALGIVFSNISPVLFTSYMGIGNLVAGSSVPVANLLLDVFILIGYILAFFSAGNLSFYKKEV